MTEVRFDDLYAQYNRLLFSIAYRMVGTVSDAEDIVHDVYLQLSEINMDQIENKKAYLCKMVTNRCLDYLKSARKKREVYVGPWLPEPLILQENDPLREVMNGELVSFAVLLLLDNLKPVERAVFVLREVFEYDYEAISSIVGKSEVNCRKILNRVKGKFPLNEESATETNSEAKERVIRTFISAINQGNLTHLEELLTHDVTLYSDGGGKVKAALRPVQSIELVIRFIEHLVEQFYQADKQPFIQMVNINGQTGLIAVGPDGVKTALCFHIVKERIKDIYIVRNPDKLRHVIIPCN